MNIQLQKSNEKAILRKLVYKDFIYHKIKPLYWIRFRSEGWTFIYPLVNLAHCIECRIRIKLKIPPKKKPLKFTLEQEILSNGKLSIEDLTNEEIKHITTTNPNNKL